MTAPTPPASSDGLTETFRSHANYLRAFTQLAGLPPVGPADRHLEGVAKLVATAYPARSPQPLPDLDTAWACLNRSWGTEVILNTARQFSPEDELVRLANSWGVVQTYYVGYGATQALIVAEGRSRPQNHQATQKQAVDLWCTRTNAAGLWSFAIGSTVDKATDHAGVIKGPGRPLKDLHAWTGCTSDTCWDIAARALRSTRQQAVKDNLSRLRREKALAKKKKWKAEEVERVAAGKKARQGKEWPAQSKLTLDESRNGEAQIRPYTWLDYLFRLRIKANYEDARMFTEGPEAEHESRLVLRDLVGLSAASLLAHEIRVSRIVGGKTFLAAVDSWIDRTASPQQASGLVARRELLAAYVT